MDEQNHKYGRSEYHFKSPHWKGEWGKTFNHLSKLAGDHRVMPSQVPYDKNAWEHRETPENLNQTEEIVEMLHKFTELKDFTSLEILENTLPLRYVYVLPARYGVVIYSAYSFLVSHDPGTLADYRDVREYLGVPNKTKRYSLNSRYYVYALLKHYFRLYTVSKPFRCLSGLPLREPKKLDDRDKHYDMISNATNITEDYTIKMPEWKTLSSPGTILTTVHKILLEHGFRIALQFVRYAYRASGLIRDLLLKKGDIEKIKKITFRYLNFDVLLEHMNSDANPDNMEQSSLEDWTD